MNGNEYYNENEIDEDGIAGDELHEFHDEARLMNLLRSLCHNDRFR